MGRGGVVEDILYENIQADGVRQVFNFNMDAFATTWLPEQFRQPAPPEKSTPAFRTITVRNLTAKNCGAAGHLTGLAQSPLRDITLENINIEAKGGFTIRNALGLQFKNVNVNGKPVSPPQETLNDGQSTRPTGG
jgi:hypothetical protein